MKKILFALALCGWLADHANGQNTSYGTGAGNTGSENTSVGYYAGDRVSGYQNSFFGAYTGFNTTSGGGNFFGGAYSGYGNTTGSGNLFLGSSSGRTNTEGIRNIYLGLSTGYYNSSGRENIAIGAYAGYYSEGGKYNVSIGSNAGSNNQADYNTFIGVFTGYKNETGKSNLFAGNDAGFSNLSGSYNVYLGPLAGHRKANGSMNVFIGNESGGNATGNSNVFVGSYSGYSNSADHNTFIGVNSGQNNDSGTNNLFQGFSAGRSNITGSDNVYLGYHAGSTNTVGTGNIFIGKQAGYYETGSNKFYLANSYSNALLYGDFTTRNIAVGGVTTSSYRLYVMGDAYATGIWISSDKKWKHEEKKLKGALEVINKFEPKSYEFKQNKSMERMSFSSGKHYGFIAQDLQKVMPELVREDTDGSLAVNYIEIIPLLTQAIQELSQKQEQIDLYKSELQEIKSQLALLTGKSEKNTGTSNLEEEQNIKGSRNIQFFPNPARGEVKVLYKTNERATDVQLRIFDMQGKWEKTISNLTPGYAEVRIQDINLSAGIYHVALIQDGEVISTSKLIIE